LQLFASFKGFTNPTLEIIQRIFFGLFYRNPPDLWQFQSSQVGHGDGWKKRASGFTNKHDFSD